MHALKAIRIGAQMHALKAYRILDKADGRPPHQVVAGEVRQEAQHF